MYSLLPLAIGICIFLSSCATPSKTTIPTIYTSYWAQPTNKHEKCELLIEGYTTKNSKIKIYSAQWDGACKDGKASGLGKVTMDRGAISNYEIGFLDNGISKQYFVQGTFGMSDVVLGEYIREHERPVIKYICEATLNKSHSFNIEQCTLANHMTGLSEPKEQVDGFTNIILAMMKKYNGIRPNSSKKKAPKTSGSSKMGTGFFVSNDGYLITNSHVANGSENISIMLDGQRVPAVLVDDDSNNDIALLKVDKSVVGLPLELRNKVKRGADIAVLGYPNIGLQGNEQKATFGFINANSGVKGDTRHFQISSPIQPGNSGSPMVNEKGIVLGIASATLSQSAALKSSGTIAQNVNYAIKVTYALPMLINHGVTFIEPTDQKPLKKTELIERISSSVVLVVSE